ncbi:hypothetical protein J7K93_08350 [bacterium]|nr:hypothetical protein [bacterium]
MTDHIEPSHLDAPVRSLTGSSITKRTAGSYHEIERNSNKDNKHSEKDEEEKENKQKDGLNRNEDRYEREFGDTVKKNEVKIKNENKNSDPEGPGVVIDVTV